MPTKEHGSAALLDRAYHDLDLVGGTLVEATSAPVPGEDPRTWSNLGEWLLLAARVGAERVFFVNDDPVLVFSSLPAGADEREVVTLYRRTWSLARPRCLFLEISGELRVYALTRPPSAPGEEEDALEPLEIVRRAADVGEALARFHRERIESGAAFEDPDLAEQSGRADQQLLRDVRVATSALTNAGLASRMAHALIERAILVRYLEDRGVLTTGYFEELGARHPRWTNILQAHPQVPDFGPASEFVRCLGDKDLTYALFAKLGEDFNGDLFVPDPAERDTVEARHLRMLRDFLQGTTRALQDPLFLWAYDFSVVPTTLVSTMYELFYHQEVDGRATSTYYTPPQLVEFVLADTLNAEVLEREPTVCDPACGSGIFLVEAFRRIVRHEAASTSRPVLSTRLRELLLGRIAGCDIDESAIKLAAFSLYVAYLNYQSPQDIRSAGPLPPLIQRAGEGTPPAPLVVGDAFWPREGEVPEGSASDTSRQLPWPARGFDVVVGNPPWTEPRTRSKSLGEQWAAKRNLPVGDRSPSQLFLWRALDLVAEGGVAALLVSAKAMLNTRTTSRAFRTQWLERARLEHVVNFSQVRRDYFEQGIAPFMLLRFRRATGGVTGSVVYETARPVVGGRRGAPALARLDRRIVPQESLWARDYLWKTYSAGGHRDDALLSRLQLENSLRDLAPEEPKSQYGFQRANPDERSAHPPSPKLRRLRSLATFTSWGPLKDEWFEPVPDYVKFAPDDRLYYGRRLIVRRGVSSGFGPHARLETQPFAFRHTTYALSLDHIPAWQAKVALGTLLSALGRYWLYMVSGSWGSWRDEVRSEELLDLPLRLVSASDPATRRIVTVADALPRAITSPGRLWILGGDGGGDLPLTGLLSELDDAVADLYELTIAERDLVRDFWAAQSADAVAPVPSQAPEHGLAADLRDNGGSLGPYLKAFLDSWNPRLGKNAEFEWRVCRDSRAGAIAIIFEAHPRGERPGSLKPKDGSESWSGVLRRLGVTLRKTRPGLLLAHGIVRAVSDTSIVIVKRDEQRMWTASAAREDADATTAQVMALERA
jgi:N-6 DNA Methylase/Eco57I restriction-modification methylase